MELKKMSGKEREKNLCKSLKLLKEGIIRLQVVNPLK